MSETTPHQTDPCAEIREEFSALLDDELSPARRAAVEAHLGTCAACLRELDAMKRVSDLYAELPSVTAPADFEARVRKAVQPKPNVLPWRSRRVIALLTLATAAGLVLVALPALLERNAALAPGRVALTRQEPAEGASSDAKAPAEKAEATPIAEIAESKADEGLAPASAAVESLAAPAAPPAASTPAMSPELKEQMKALGYDSSETDEARKVAADAPAEAAPVVYQSENEAAHMTTAPQEEKPSLESVAGNSAAMPKSEPPAPAAAPAPAPGAAPMAAATPSADADYDALPDTARKHSRASAPKKSVQKRESVSRTWDAAERHFVLIDERWVQDGALPAGVTPKKIRASDREFKRLVREFPPLEALTAAILPVVFNVGEKCYELQPKTP